MKWTRGVYNNNQAVYMSAINRKILKTLRDKYVISVQEIGCRMRQPKTHVTE